MIKANNLAVKFILRPCLYLFVMFRQPPAQSILEGAHSLISFWNAHKSTKDRIARHAGPIAFPAFAQG